MILLVKLSLFFPAVLSLKFTSYANDFIDPSIVTQQPHNSTRTLAQRTIVKWASELAAQGPWCKLKAYACFSTSLTIRACAFHALFGIVQLL